VAVVKSPPIADFLSRYSGSVSDSPDATAVVAAGRSLSYREIDARSNQLAQLLLALGAGADVPVAISLPRSLEMIVGILGILKAGSAYVPLDPAYPSDRLALMLQDSAAAVVVTTAAGADHLGAGHGRSVILDLDADSLRGQSDVAPDVHPEGRDLAYIIYTSGSTGRPKGVALPRQALTNLVDWQIRQPGFEARAATLQFASLSFDVSFQEIFTTLASGGTLYLIDEDLRRDPVRLLRFIDRHAIGRLFLPFVALRQLAGAAGAEELFPRGLREIYTAGEQLFVTAEVRHLFRHLRDAILVNQYGPSETHVVTALVLTGAPDAWPDAPSIGRPIDNAGIVVLGEDRSPVPDGTQGEAYITGRCLARGYLHRPELTSERFIDVPSADGHAIRAYKSGDIVVRKADGNIFFVGRTDHQVKIRGHRVEPGEVASVLSAAPGLAQCHVVAHEIQPGIKSLVAYYKTSDGRTVGVDSLREYARGVLPPYMVPSAFHRVDEFPLTPSGKVDLKALPVPDVAAMSSETYVAPASDTERKLVTIWEEVLKVPRLSVTADFFDVGGHSLLVAAMFAKIRATFGTDLPFALLIKASTVRAMATVLDAGPRQAQGHWTSLVPIQPTGDRIPIFMIHGGLGNVLSFPIVSRGLGGDQPFYALQWSGLDGRPAQATFQDVVRDYLREIRSVRPNGPWILGGLCIGGLIAYEMARQLREKGEDVPLVVMYDSPNVWSEAYRPEEDPSQRPRLSSYLRLGPAVCWLSQLSGLPVPARYRTMQIGYAMVRVFDTHRFVRADDLNVLYISAGSCLPRSLGLKGHWTDDLLGWTPMLHDRFEVVQVEGSDHERIAHEVRSIDVLKRRLDLVNAQRAPESAGYHVGATR
jgi:amino acid adenylation domain-containing protein